MAVLKRRARRGYGPRKMVLRTVHVALAACFLLLAALGGPPAATPAVRPAYLSASLLSALQPRQIAAQAAPDGWLANPNNDDEVVYIDPDGFVRVYDQTGEPKITWVSPEGGWDTAALGDFTGDGDDEIVAVSGRGGGGRLVIYDPVVAAGATNADQQFNGIPWQQLYATGLPGIPRVVATGEFDGAMAGREIVVTIDAPPTADGDPRSLITILTQTTNPPTGVAWRTLATLTTGQQWSDVSTGDLALTGSDHIALIDEDRGVLSVFRLQGGALQRYYTTASDTREWSSSAIGQVDPATSQPELVLVRRADRPLASLVVLRYEAPDKFVDVYLRDFNPAPRVVFLADVNASGEAEIFMLRNVVRTAGCPAPYNTPPFQLIMRNRGPDRPPAFEVCLDQANTFRYGAGGDLNGDGKDEVIVISATQLRIFSNLDATFTANNVTVASNARTVLAGNLDKAGAAKPNTLAASRSSLSFTVAAGGESGVETIEVTNSASSGAPIPLFVSVWPQVDYIRWSLSSETTPATLSISVDAGQLLPGVLYAVDLSIAAVGVSAANSPLKVPILIDVTAGVIVRPNAYNVLLTPCQGRATAPAVDLRVLGTPGATFSASVVNGPVPIDAGAAAGAGSEVPAGMTAFSWEVRDVPWITSAESPTTTVPSTISLTIDPTRVAPLSQAQVIVVAQLGGQTYTRIATVSVLCTDSPLYLPAVQRFGRFR